MQKHIEELEERNRRLQTDNDTLRAMEDENQYYCHPRGEIKTELEMLRKEKIANLVEINRLEKEKLGLKIQLAEAEERIRALRITKTTSVTKKIRFTRDGCNQTNLDGIYAKAKKAGSAICKSPMIQEIRQKNDGHRAGAQ